jgi:hypothetical protein
MRKRSATRPSALRTASQMALRALISEKTRRDKDAAPSLPVEMETANAEELRRLLRARRFGVMPLCRFGPDATPPPSRCLVSQGRRIGGMRSCCRARAQSG